uniref:Alpha-defensin 9-like n=1 Tax=Jaculus jaculus TaxID=51337 RepID=A0A8C5K150_JACJA|nr:alpha-defensin 9-like [Jaculus jaculus]
MKTLALLSALALLAFLAQADLLPETAGEAPDQEQPGEEDQEVTISFGGPEGSALQDKGTGNILTCYCRKRSCIFPERRHGTCCTGKICHLFCCR